MTMNRMRIYYRASSHVPLWKVMEQGGFMEKHGLEMDFGSMEGMRGKAMQGLRAGEIDIVSGNHHNLYVRRALHGEPFVHVGQSNNKWRENCLVAGSGINSLQDLKGKRVMMDDFDGHTGLNVWLFLDLNGLKEGRDVEFVEGPKNGFDRVRAVMAGEYDATFIRVVDQMRARSIGARLLPVKSMDMIEGVTLTTTTTYVNSHPEEIRSLLLALVDGIHFFKTRRDATMEIIREHCGDKYDTDEEIAAFYDDQAQSLEARPYPTLDAVRNVFALAVKRHPDVASFNPLAMWDLHHLREIDDSGYIDKLWGE
jgi:ABC-type nitrate/sulfonate/bicarbonate transport system substrate-binding protein